MTAMARKLGIVATSVSAVLLIAALASGKGAVDAPPQPVTGRIKGKLLPAVRGAQITVYYMDRDDMILLRKVPVSARDGAYHIDGLEPVKYTLQLHAPLRVTEERDVELTAGQTADLGSVTLDEGGAISGRITPAGVPPGDAPARVEATRRDKKQDRLPDGGAFVDRSTGKYVVDGLPAGTYDITIEAKGRRKVIGIRNLVSAPGDLSASDIAGIREFFVTLVRLWNADDPAAELSLYSQSFRDEWGRGFDGLRKSKEAIKRTQRNRELKCIATLTVERILPGRDDAAAICRFTYLWINLNPHQEQPRTITGFKLFGLRKEQGVWRITFLDNAMPGEAQDASEFTTDSRVSGIQVLAGKVSQGHDWQLVYR